MEDKKMSIWFHMLVPDIEALARSQAELLKSLPKIKCGACGSEMPNGYWHSCSNPYKSEPLPKAKAARGD